MVTQETADSFLVELVKGTDLLQNELLKKHGMSMEQAILYLKSLAIAQSTKYALICGLSEDEVVEESRLVYRAVRSQLLEGTQQK